MGLTRRGLGGAATVPVDMLLDCPNCGHPHIDDPLGDWTNPPHRSHLCARCGYVWRPADVCTNGVLAVKTAGKNDSPIVARGSVVTLIETMTILGAQVRDLLGRP